MGGTTHTIVVIVGILVPGFIALLGIIWKIMYKRVIQNEARIEEISGILQRLETTMQNHLATVGNRLTSIETDVEWIKDALKTNLEKQDEIFRQLQTKQDRE